jgi:hypothetical protein
MKIIKVNKIKYCLLLFLVLDDSSASNERVSNGRKLFDTIRKWISNFNLFEHGYNDAHGRRTEIITTRIYLILMFIGLIVIIFYASLVQYSITYRVREDFLLE